MRLLLALASSVLAAGASPVQGSISGPVTAVHGKTFTVATKLSPTGKSTVRVAATTTILEQAAGTRADLKQGACVTATGTRKGSAVAATRIALRPSSGANCGGGFFGRAGKGSRPPGSRPRNARPPGSGSRRFTPPANLGFAIGRIAAVKGSTLTVKGSRGSTAVTVSAKTAISKTVTLHASAVKTTLCAFVFGTSSDKGVTVRAASVSLTKPVQGSCTFRRRPQR